ncbi:hypothetical protein MCOR25_004037 [Pyricularia grisea]|nr:hypothetical protein MCOR25_004037 [Pyricularia grisea]
MLEHRRSVWVCHVCEKNVSNRGLDQGSKEKGEKGNEEEQESMYNGLTPCELCRSAWYCSERCRKKDWLVHIILCSQYQFIRKLQKPALKSKEPRCIGIELPVDGTAPKPIWISYGGGFSNRPQQRHDGILRTTFVWRQDPLYNLGVMMGGAPQFIKLAGPFWGTRLYVARRQSSLLHPANECVTRLLRKLGPATFDSIKGFFDPDQHMQEDNLFWKGPIVLFRRTELFFSMKAVDVGGPLGGRHIRTLEVQKMEDMTLADLSWALEYLAWRQLEVVEHPETANLVPEDWSQWIRSKSDGEDLEEIDK